MTFLALPTMLVAASVVLPLLLALYFLKLRRRPLRVGSVMLWEQAVRDLQVNSPLAMIRPRLMLFVHLLLALLALLAIGRPAIDMPRPGARAVVLIDCSMSMNALVGRAVVTAGDSTGQPGRPVTYLDLAKQKARDLVNAMSGDSEILIGTMAIQTQARSSFSRDRVLLNEAIDAVTATDQPEDLDAALAFARGLRPTGQAGQSDEEPMTVYLITDMVVRRGTQPPDAGGLDLRVVAVELPVRGELGNVGITNAALTRDEVDPTTLRLFVRMSNNGAAQSVPLTVTLNGRAMTQGTRVIDLMAGSPQSPSQTTQTIDLTDATGPGQSQAGVLEVAVGVLDALASDNRCGFVLEAFPTPVVIMVSPPDEPDKFVLSLLQELFAGPTDGQRAEVKVVTQQTWRAELAGIVQPAGGGGRRPVLLVFDRVAAGDLSDLPKVPSIHLGTGLGTLSIQQIPSPESQVSRFVSWNRKHPAMRFAQLDTIFLSGRTRLAGVPEDRLGETSPGINELIRGPDGPLAVAVQDGTISRVVVGFDVQRSNWLPHVSFLVFMHDAAGWLLARSESLSAESFSTVEPASALIQPMATAAGQQAGVPAGLSLMGPRNEVLAISVAPNTPAAADGRWRVNLGTLARSGVYRLTRTGAAATDATLNATSNDGAVSVNSLDGTESSLNRLAAIEVRGAAASLTAGSEPKELWPWLLWAMAGLMVVEWVIYGWGMRK